MTSPTSHSARDDSTLVTNTRTSVEYLTGLLEMQSHAIIAVDHDQRIMLFNRGAERIFGYRFH